jgi:hypothetical protein
VAPDKERARDYSAEVNIAAARAALGLRAGHSATDVETAFRVGARRLHPDHGGDPDRFRALVEARDVLRAGAAARPESASVVVVPDTPLFQQLIVATIRHLWNRRPLGRGPRRVQ